MRNVGVSIERTQQRHEGVFDLEFQRCESWARLVNLEVSGLQLQYVNVAELTMSVPRRSEPVLVIGGKVGDLERQKCKSESWSWRLETMLLACSLLSVAPPQQEEEHQPRLSVSALWSLRPQWLWLLQKLQHPPPVHGLLGLLVQSLKYQKYS